MDIHESMGRILDSEDLLGDLFYSVFFESYPDVQKYFEGIDMRAQAALLTTALVIIERNYAIDSPAAKSYLRVLGSRHCQREIPEEAYAQWTEAMLQTLEKFHDQEWDQHLGDQWRDAIGRATEAMFEGYKESFHV